MSNEPSSSSSHTSLLNPDQLKTSKNEKDERPPMIHFDCHSCNMHQTCDYFGSHPPFSPTNKFAEDCFIKKDPFAPHPGSSKPAAEFLLVLGANCYRCAHSVCRSPNCSIFYRFTVCLNCAGKTIKEYPTEIQSKIRKKINEAAG